MATQKNSATNCLIMIGMAGAGKSTIGRELASLLNWSFIDSDRLIEEKQQADLQHIVDSMGRRDFLDLEAEVIQSLNCVNCVIATGGSVVYRPAAIMHLKELGPLIYIDVSLALIIERIKRQPDRGLALLPGQKVEDLYNERHLLYEQAADITISGGEAPAATYARQIAVNCGLLKAG